MKAQIADMAHACSRATLTLRGFILLAAALAVTACATGGPYQLNLMPVPDVYQDGAIDPFTDANPIEKIPYSGILYATTRAPAAEKDGYYLNQRGGVLRLGVARIELGREGMTWEEAREISLAKNRNRQVSLESDRGRGAWHPRSQLHAVLRSCNGGGRAPPARRRVCGSGQ